MRGCCKTLWLFRCHVLAKRKGGRVIDNIVLLDLGCHDEQEKKNEQYETVHNIDLYAIAAAHTAQWRKEKGR